MVRLTRISSDFNIAKMRDSFMRQFVEQGGENDLSPSNKEEEDEVKTSSKHTEVQLLLEQRAKSLMGTSTKKAAVTSLIRYWMWSICLFIKDSQSSKSEVCSS